MMKYISPKFDYNDINTSEDDEVLLEDLFIIKLFWERNEKLLEEIRKKTELCVFFKQNQRGERVFQHRR